MTPPRRIRSVWLWSAVAALLVALAVTSHLPLRGIVWPRAERVMPVGLGVNYERVEHWLVVGRGRVGVVSQQLTGLVSFRSEAAGRNSRAILDMTFTQRFGARPWPRVEHVAGLGPSVLVPGWMLAGIGGLAAWRAHRIAKRHAGVRQPCEACGYERLGLPPAANCPECGAHPAPKLSA